jgi:ribose-phosphate pyrophosphokinase
VTLLLAHPGHERLAESLGRALGAEPVSFEIRRFPDGETYLRVDSGVQGRPVVVLCTLRDPDPLFLPLAFIADTLRDLGARSVGLAAPYLGYMRQDRRFQPGEALTSASFARLISARFDWLVTVDPHLHRRQSLAEIYTIPTVAARAAPLLARWIREGVARPLVVGPDAESEQWVRAVADLVPCPYFVLEKTRHGDRDVSVSDIPREMSRAGATPVLVDDIISSAGTMIETVRRCGSAGLAAPVCLAVHAVFTTGAHEALVAGGAARVVTTNTIPHPSNAIDVAGLLAGAIAGLLPGQVHS